MEAKSFACLRISPPLNFAAWNGTPAFRALRRRRIVRPPCARSKHSPSPASHYSRSARSPRARRKNASPADRSSSTATPSRSATSSVRLFGVDAPEGRQSCKRDGRDWACGDEAARKLRSLVGDRSITCTQRDIDDYRRIVATCRAGNVDLAAEMARSGFATAYRRYSNDYVDEENEARAARPRHLGRRVHAARDLPQRRSANARTRATLLRQQGARATAASIKGNISARRRPHLSHPRLARVRATPESTKREASGGSAPKLKRAQRVGARPARGDRDEQLTNMRGCLGSRCWRRSAGRRCPRAQALPNPYRLVDGWAKLQGGREVGAVGDVDIDVDGRHVWAVLRCDAGGDKFGYECLDSNLDVVVKFAPDGNADAELRRRHCSSGRTGSRSTRKATSRVTDAATVERTTAQRQGARPSSREVQPERAKC